MRVKVVGDLLVRAPAKAFVAVNLRPDEQRLLIALRLVLGKDLIDANLLASRKRIEDEHIHREGADFQRVDVLALVANHVPGGVLDVVLHDERRVNLTLAIFLSRRQDVELLHGPRSFKRLLFLLRPVDLRDALLHDVDEVLFSDLHDVAFRAQIARLAVLDLGEQPFVVGEAAHLAQHLGVGALLFAGSGTALQSPLRANKRRHHLDVVGVKEAGVQHDVGRRLHLGGEQLHLPNARGDIHAGGDALHHKEHILAPLIHAEGFQNGLFAHRVRNEDQRSLGRIGGDFG